MDTTMDVGYGPTKNFDALEAKMGDGFMSSAILQRHPGGHNLAGPIWTTIPILYHAPPHYDIREIVASTRVDKSVENRKYTLQDGYGTIWEVDADNLAAHSAAIKSVQKHASEGLSAMKCFKYYEAAKNFNTALSELWPCHRNTPLDRWIKTHRGHALLRAGLLQCPALHFQSTRALLEESWVTISECVNTLRPQHTRANAFDRSLLFSGLLGLAWISFFRGNLEDAQKYIEEAQTVRLDCSHLRADRDIDTIFFQVALHRLIGTTEDIEHWLGRLGHKLSDHEEDIFHVDILDNELEDLTGMFNVSVTRIAAYDSNPLEKFNSWLKTEQIVLEYLDRLWTAHRGNTWFALGACRQARLAYEYAHTSESLLLRAAALVGLGNVIMRLSDVVKREVFASVGNEETKTDGSKLGFTDAEKKYKEALEIYDEIGFKGGQIIVQCNLGNLYHKRAKFQEALERYTTAITYLSENMSKSSAALHLHLKFAELHLEMGNWVEAFNSLKNVAAIPKTINRLEGAWVEHLNGSYHLKRAMATESKELERLNDLSEAKNHLCKATKILAEVQLGLRYSSLWLIIFEQQKETYALLLWCLAYQSDGTSTASAVEALVWSERSRSRALMVERWPYFFSRVSTHLSDEVAAIESLKATASQAFDTLPCEESWKHLRVLLSRCKLPAATTVIEYVLCADFGFLIFVLDMAWGEPKMLRVSFKDCELRAGEKLDREKLTALVNRTVSLLDPKSAHKTDEAETNLASLYKLLIKPVEKWLKKTQQIIVIPHEVLFKVPFHSLIDGKRKYLIEVYKISCAESIRSLIQCSLEWERSIHSRLVQDDQHDSVLSKRTTSRKTRWLVVGINKHRPVAGDLNYAEYEAENVAGLLSKELECNGSGHQFLGFQATRDQLMPHFDKADIIHLATHGIINSKFERGGILLAVPAGVQIGGNGLGIVDLELSHSAAESAGTPTRSYGDLQESFRWFAESESLEKKIVLGANEISTMNLEAQLVVLSACQSADGVILGEGVAGLGRALLQAGVPCTVLSLWPVSDTATVYFMKEFYRGFARGQPVANAMQTAMVTMINSVEHYSKQRRYSVRQWAAFLAFGLPIVRVADSLSTVDPLAALPPSSLRSQLTDKLPKLLAGSVGAVLIGVVALAQASRSKALTRSTASEASVQCVWNPLHLNPRVPTKPPPSRGRRLGPLIQRKLMLFAYLAIAIYKV